MIMLFHFKSILQLGSQLKWISLAVQLSQLSKPISFCILRLVFQQSYPFTVAKIGVTICLFFFSGARHSSTIFKVSWSRCGSLLLWPLISAMEQSGQHYSKRVSICENQSKAPTYCAIHCVCACVCVFQVIYFFLLLLLVFMRCLVRTFSSLLRHRLNHLSIFCHLIPFHLSTSKRIRFSCVCVFVFTLSRFLPHLCIFQNTITAFLSFIIFRTFRIALNLI